MKRFQSSKCLPDFQAALQSRNWGDFKHAQDLAYYARVKKNGWKLTPENAPIVTTIHGSKGRERDHVVQRQLLDGWLHQYIIAAATVTLFNVEQLTQNIGWEAADNRRDNSSAFQVWPMTGSARHG